MAIEVKNVSKSFKKGFSTHTVLENIDLTINNGELVCILGPSGCGKTTLIRIIAGLEFADSGEVYDDGELVIEPSAERGFIFQQYSLFPWLTVIENVMFGLDLKGDIDDSTYELAEEYLDLVGLLEFKDSYPHELSGGMKQRVAIIRSLINNNRILLMDEPFSAIDIFNRHYLQNQILEINERVGNTILFVTHDVEESVYVSDRIIVMDSHPGVIKEIIDVDLPHPRERGSSEFMALENKVKELLGILNDD